MSARYVDRLALKLLLVEDSDDDATLLLRELHISGFAVECERVQTAEEMLRALRGFTFDAIISDYSLPKFDAPAALRLVHELQVDVPFIIVSGTIGEDVAVACLKAGAHDFVTKANLARLAPALEREMLEADGRRQRHVAELALRESEKMFAASFHMGPNPMVIIGGDGRMVEMNQAFFTLTGYHPDEVRGRTAAELGLLVEGPADAQLATVLRKGEGLDQAEVQIRTKSGEWRSGLLSAEVVEIKNERCLLVDFADITERKRAELALREAHAELQRAYDSTLAGWSRALELRDTETEGHSRRVTALTVELARAAGMTPEQIVHVQRGALLHDIGKMAVPDAILLKPGPLDPEEREVMRRHPRHAYEMLSPIPFLRPALDIPFSHHERWDGMGYPQGLEGEETPLAARLFAIVDVWDALISSRPYKDAWPEERALEHIHSLSGSHLDPNGVKLFEAMLARRDLTKAA